MVKSQRLLNTSINAGESASGDTLRVGNDDTQTFQITGDSNADTIELVVQTKVRDDGQVAWADHDTVTFDLTDFRNNSTSYPVDIQDNQLVRPVIVNNGTNASTIQVDEGRRVNE